MKTTVIVLAVLLLAAVGITGKAMTTPAERTIEKTQTLVKFEQQGSFDYRVTATPSFLQGGEAPVEAEAVPIPLSYIESCTMTYDFTSGSGAGSSISVDAILENPNTWQKAVNLASRAGTGSLSFPVELAYLQAIADAINKEIGVGTGSMKLTIRATVTNGINSNGQPADFIQELPVELTRTVLKIGDELGMSRGDAAGTFGYQIQLKENLLYGPVTITPPGQQSGTTVTLGPEDTVFLKLVQSMEVDYNYRLTAEPQIQQLQSEVTIQAIAANPDVWSRSYDLVPAKTYDEEVKVSFPLDFDSFTGLYEKVQQETGVAASEQQLTLMATVHTTGRTDRGRIDETFTQGITTNLRAGVLKWEGDLKKAAPGAVESKQTVVEAVRVLGRPVLEIRIIGAFLTATLLILLGLYLWHNRRQQESASIQLARKAAEMERKYNSLFVQVNGLPVNRIGDTILPVESMEDLVKVGQGLLKPINHAWDKNIHLYWVYDDHKRYEYQLIHQKLAAITNDEIGVEPEDGWKNNNQN